MLRGLTGPRAAVLDALRAQPDPVGIQALSTLLGRHHNTVREQVNWLVAQGFVRRHRVPGEGRGRPTWRYQALGPKPGAQEHAERAADLTWTMSESGALDPEAARSQGVTWGRERGGVRRTTAREARAATVAVLDDLGFQPVADGDVRDVLLTRCPLLQAAHEFESVVCALHEGFVEGLLDAHGAGPTDVELVPFGAVGGCPLTLSE